jgi:drug/metabolite transporter (DMT)-like permease
MSTRSSGLLILIIAAALWSVSGVAVKLVQAPSPIAFTFFRAVGAALLMALCLPLARGRWPHLGWGVLAGVVCAANTALLIESMSAGTAAQGIALQYTGPMWTALLARLIFGKRFAWQTWLAVSLVGLGVGLMLFGAFFGESTNRHAIVTGAGSGVCFGVLILVLDHLDRVRPGTDAIKIVFVMHGTGALLFVPLYLASSGPAIAPLSAAAVVLVGVVQLGLPYLLFQFGMRRTTPVEASLVSVLEPVLNPIWVWIAVRENPGPWVLAGGACIMAAVAVEAMKPRTVNT